MAEDVADEMVEESVEDIADEVSEEPVTDVVAEEAVTEETEPIEEIIEEVITVVSQKEELNLNLNKENLILSIVSKEVIMNRALTLSDYNVKQGMKLILV